ncbi:KAP family P-loop NTPase fold protein [Oenococcus oeni]|nr:P-loop NTPase fold protein [Oenococcus oeni]
MLIIVLLLLLFSKWQPIRRIKSPFLNQIDQAAFIVAGSVILDILILLILHTMLIIDISLVAVIAMLHAAFVFFRNRLIYERPQAQPEAQLLDLQDIRYPTKGKYDLTNSFLVKETEVDYDLLSRDSLIQDLQTTINHYNSPERFVIGIEGPWGSGKSTLIKNAIACVDKNRVIIIDDFEPWLYKDQISLVDDLFRKIFGQDSLRLSSQQIKAVTNLALSLMFGNKGNSLLDNWFSNNRDRSSELNGYFEDINMVLEKDNKKILLIIDNLDRIESENIFLILNLVNNVLNLKRLLVVLLYDKGQLEGSLKKIGINPGYLNKIVQKKISIPVRSKKYLSGIYAQALINIAAANGIDFDTKNSEVTGIVSFLAENFDLREFKRFINSSIAPYLKIEKRLFFPDYLAVEIIKFRDFSVYERIYREKYYFTSSERRIELELSSSSDDGTLTEFNEFFKNLFADSSFKEYLNLLAICFSNVTIFKSKAMQSSTNYRLNPLASDGPTDEQTMRNKRMMNSSFFDAYFNTGGSLQIETLDFAKELIASAASSDTLNSKFADLSRSSFFFKRNLLTGINLYIEDLQPKDLFTFTCQFLDFYLDRDIYLPANDSYKSSIAITAGELCKRFSVLEFQKIVLQYCCKDPKNLSFVDILAISLQNALKADNDKDIDLQGKLDFLNQKFQIFLNKIYSDKEGNLYDKGTYSRANIYNMSRFLHKADPGHYPDATLIIKTYVDSHMNTENAYRVLNDMIRETRIFYGGISPYTYEMADDYEKLVDANRLSELLEKNPTQNEKQAFIKTVFDARDRADKAIPSNDSIALDTID